MQTPPPGDQRDCKYKMTFEMTKPISRCIYCSYRRAMISMTTRR